MLPTKTINNVLHCSGYSAFIYNTPNVLVYKIFVLQRKHGHLHTKIIIA